MYSAASDDWMMDTHEVHVDADVPMTNVEVVLPFANADRTDPNNSVLCCTLCYCIDFYYINKGIKVGQSSTFSFEHPK